MLSSILRPSNNPTRCWVCVCHQSWCFPSAIVSCHHQSYPCAVWTHTQIQDMPRDFTLQNLELLMSEQGLNNLTTPPLTGERALEIGWRVGKFPTGPGTLYRWPGGQRWYKARPKTGRRLACLDDAAYDVAMGCVGALRRDESLVSRQCADGIACRRVGGWARRLGAWASLESVAACYRKLTACLATQ